MNQIAGKKLHVGHLHLLDIGGLAESIFRRKADKMKNKAIIVFDIVLQAVGLARIKKAMAAGRKIHCLYVEYIIDEVGKDFGAVRAVTPSGEQKWYEETYQRVIKGWYDIDVILNLSINTKEDTKD